MSTALPGPPKHRSSLTAQKGPTVGLADDTRLKLNGGIIVAQLFLVQIGVWGLFRTLLNKTIGETLAMVIDWSIVLIPTFNVLEALWARANRPQPAPVASQGSQPSVTPTQKRIQTLSTTVPNSILAGSSFGRPKANVSQMDNTPSRKDLRFPELPSGYAGDSSFNASPSPSVQARSRMKASQSLRELSSKDLFTSRASSVEPGETGSLTNSITGPSRSRRRHESASSREPSPFSISTLSLKNVPKPGRALDSSSLRGLVS